MSNANEPAYPVKLEKSHPEHGTGTAYFPGLTKREYFAAMAIQGYVSDPDWRHDMSQDATARAAVNMADALLAELECTK